jgi:transcriptional regulator with XRE-family HTH domain
MANPTTATLDPPVGHRSGRVLSKAIHIYETGDRALASAAGMSHTAINNYKRGKRSMDPEVMDAIAAGFDRITPPAADEPPFDVALFLRTPRKLTEWLLENRRSLFLSNCTSDLVA